MPKPSCQQQKGKGAKSGSGKNDRRRPRKITVELVHAENERTDREQNEPRSDLAYVCTTTSDPATEELQSVREVSLGEEEGEGSVFQTKREPSQSIIKQQKS